MPMIRVFMLPASLATARYLFSGGEPATFLQVDWFGDGAGINAPAVGSDAWKDTLTGFLRQKRYFVPGRAYLVLHPEHSFTIDYRA